MQLNKTSPLLDFHLLDVEYEAAVEDIESHCALPTKKNDLIVSEPMHEGTQLVLSIFGLAISCHKFLKMS